MKYHSKYKNENKIVDISSLPSCQSVYYIARGGIMLHVSGKDTQKQVLNLNDCSRSRIRPKHQHMLDWKALPKRYRKNLN